MRDTACARDWPAGGTQDHATGRSAACETIVRLALAPTGARWVCCWRFRAAPTASRWPGAWPLLKAEGPGRLAVAHFNHRLRGAESDADQSFVVALCEQLSLDCVVGTAEPAQLAADGEGLEAAARAARYEFLRQTAEAAGGPLRRHRTHGRRSGRNRLAPHPAWHRPGRAGGHAAARARWARP